MKQTILIYILASCVALGADRILYVGTANVTTLQPASASTNPPAGDWYPTNISGLYMWYEAQYQATGTVSVWTNHITTSASNFLQVTDTAQPTNIVVAGEFNGTAQLVFDTANDHITNSVDDIWNTYNFTVLIIGRWQNSGWSRFAGGAGDMFGMNVNGSANSVALTLAGASTNITLNAGTNYIHIIRIPYTGTASYWTNGVLVCTNIEVTTCRQKTFCLNTDTDGGGAGGSHIPAFVAWTNVFTDAQIIEATTNYNNIYHVY